MALTIAFVKRYALPAGKGVIADITFDNSYPTGGESLAPADVGMISIQHVSADQKGVGNRIAQYDYANSKLKLYTALGTEATNASDQSTIVVRANIIGDQAG